MTATVISPVECGILAIKKTLKTLQIGLYSIFLNMSIKCIQEKEKEKDLILKKKEHSFISTSLQCNIKNHR